MQTILVVYTAIHFPAYLREAAVAITRQRNAVLQAVEFPYEGHPDDYAFPNDLEETADPVWEEAAEQENKLLEQHMLRLLYNDALGTGISITTQRVNGLDELVALTRDADLLVTDGAINCSGATADDLLAGALCPVFVAAHDTGAVERLVLAYDGSPSSQKAIGQLAGLFPEWSRLPAVCVTVNMDERAQAEHQSFFYQYLPAHFAQPEIRHLKGPVTETLVHFLQQFAGHTLVVMGAYGRGALSRFFSPSKARPMMEAARVALFIAHD